MGTTTAAGITCGTLAEEIAGGLTYLLQAKYPWESDGLRMSEQEAHSYLVSRGTDPIVAHRALDLARVRDANAAAGRLQVRRDPAGDFQLEPGGPFVSRVTARGLLISEYRRTAEEADALLERTFP